MAVYSQDYKTLIIPTSKGNLLLSIPVGLSIEEVNNYLDEFVVVFVNAINQNKEKEGNSNEQSEPDQSKV